LPLWHSDPCVQPELRVSMRMWPINTNRPGF
jgi:hypothetical protein